MRWQMAFGKYYSLRWSHTKPHHEASIYYHVSFVMEIKPKHERRPRDVAEPWICSINISLKANTRKNLRRFILFFHSCLSLSFLWNNECRIFGFAINWFIIYGSLFSTFSKKDEKNEEEKKIVREWPKQNCQSVSGTVSRTPFPPPDKMVLALGSAHNENDERKKNMKEESAMSPTP